MSLFAKVWVKPSFMSTQAADGKGSPEPSTTSGQGWGQAGYAWVWSTSGRMEGTGRYHPQMWYIELCLTSVVCVYFSSPLPSHLPTSLSALPLHPHRNSLSLLPACALVLSAFQWFMHETNYALLIWKLAALLLTFI